MTREIKFRAWDTKNNFMAKPFEMINIPQIVMAYLVHNHGFLMQYTGLKDKNGKEIYEGDIFGLPRVNQYNEFFGKVVFDGDFGGFVVHKPNGGFDFIHVFLIENRTAEVYGNIYENPELLQDTNKS